MSDEESFVILGSSPMSSMENYGLATHNHSMGSFLKSDTPGTRFTSLKNSQITDLKNAQEITQTTNHNLIQPEMAETVVNSSLKSQPNSNQLTQKDDPAMRSVTETRESIDKEKEIAGKKLWSRSDAVQLENNLMALSFEDCALKSPLEQHEETKNVAENSNALLNLKTLGENKSITTSKSTSSSSSNNGSLATSFIMGEVNSDVLKTSVYSQFPSISMEACPEDVVKLQNMVTEYTQLKTTIKKANNTMKQFYYNSLQWKDKIKTIEEQYKEQLDKCKEEIEELRKQNKELESSFKMQIEALEIARKQDREENVQELSEKTALLENMRAQIIKLEQQQLASFEFVPHKQDDPKNEQFNKYFITHREHEVKIKELQTQLSEILASNLDLKDVEKQYLDQLNCLGVNLAAAEELIKKNRTEIEQLTAVNIEKQQQIKTLEDSLKTLQLAYEEQKERILLLETQNLVHRADFEMEKESRETVLKEKQQILQDLRSLQKRNQELIEEHQKQADAFQKRLSAASVNQIQFTAASAAAQTYFNNPQRPIRVLPSPSTAQPPEAMHMCPICNKSFKSLTFLLSHVNDCVDKN